MLGSIKVRSTPPLAFNVAGSKRFSQLRIIYQLKKTEQRLVQKSFAIYNFATHKIVESLVFLPGKTHKNMGLKFLVVAFFCIDRMRQNTCFFLCSFPIQSKGVFRTLSNMYDEAFYFILIKGSMIDV